MASLERELNKLLQCYPDLPYACVIGCLHLALSDIDKTASGLPIDNYCLVDFIDNR